jgi:hypothetical protein
MQKNSPWSDHYVMIYDDCADTGQILLQYNYSVKLTTNIGFLIGPNGER